MFGATAANAVGVIGQNNRRFLFEEENLTVADGLAKSGGLLDERADARSVFLYRMVPRGLLERAGVDVSNLTNSVIPTVFQVDLSKAEGYFIAHSFYLQNKDIIYVSASPANELTKFLSLLTSVPNAAGSIAGNISVVRAATAR